MNSQFSCLILPQEGLYASPPPAWDAFVLTVGRGSRGLLQHLEQPLGGLTPRLLSLPLSQPEKIFSEAIPKCEKCQSVVKPGEPQGWGLRAWDWSWDPFPPLALTHPKSGHSATWPVPYCSAEGGYLFAPTPGLRWAPTPDCSRSVSHVSSHLSLCASVCLSLRYRVFR